MTFTIEDDEVDRLAERLASMVRVDKVEAVRIALVGELQRYETSQAEFLRRLRPLQARLSALPATGLPADKVFYDSLNDE